VSRGARSLAKIPLVHQPGTTFEYSVSTDVLGHVLERIAGKPLDQVVDELVLLSRPVGERVIYFPGNLLGETT